MTKNLHPPRLDALRELYLFLPDQLYGGSRVSVRGLYGPLEPNRGTAVRRALVRDLAVLAVDLVSEGRLP